jgi:hypothetical protein
MHAYSMRETRSPPESCHTLGPIRAVYRAPSGRAEPVRYAGSNFIAMPLMQ